MLNNLQNLHTHSTLCDGKDTLEEMVKAAIDKGFSSIGFSSHSYMHFSTVPSMTAENTVIYKNEIARLKKKYEGIIDIFCGLEFEKYSIVDLSGYDYIIGSVHYLKIGDEYVGIDRNLQTIENVTNTYFGGDGLKCAKAYYDELSTIAEKGNFDIIGHFDIIAKHYENSNLFDVTSKEYLNFAFDAIDTLKGKITLFEINTGAISRGYRTTPYPHHIIVKRLLEKGFLPTISSDCHNKDYLDCGFEDAVKLLEDCGAKERYILTKDGFKAVPLR